MSKILVLAEKPSVGRDLAGVLKCHKKGNGCLEGDKYIVTWALGHLVTLADPEAYDDKYKAWRIEDLPMMPNQLKLVVIKQTGKQFQAVKTQMLRKDVSEIVIATDAGREGELVARWIIEKVQVRKPIKRLWISSVTEKAIREGFAKLKHGKEFENLYAAAVARSEADWYVGMNATRALTTKYNAQLSCGRVQTPTLAIIAAREAEIRNFQSKPFYGLTAEAERFKLTWQIGKAQDTRTFDKAIADHALKQLQAVKPQQAKIMEVQKKAKKSYAPALYDLTELQRDANQMFGYSAKDTLSIMQRLYEQHKVVTYPRTDSRYLSSDMVGTLKDRIQACAVGPYASWANKLMRQPIKANKSFVDDQKVSDHHAIVPTEERVNLMALNDKERKIYDLIAKRFLAVLMPPCEYEQTKLTAEIGGERFTAKGNIISQAGWKEIYDQRLSDDEDQDDLVSQQLPDLKQGDVLKLRTIKLTTGQTQPPAPFNEGTLLKAMENPIPFIPQESKELKKTLGETGGLGTVATRADIIEKLLNSFLIEKRGKDLFITSKGKQLLELAPEDLRSPVLTAVWERKLDAIAKGKLPKEKFIQEIKAYTKQAVVEIKQSDKQFRHDNMTSTKCPDCGKQMLQVKGKRGIMLVCQDRECGHRKQVAQTTNARCPNCRKKLELRGEGEGRVFVCVCGHKEKLSAFNERREKEKQKSVSKKDVQHYLKKQQKQQDEPLNTVLADALAKLKLK